MKHHHKQHAHLRWWFTIFRSCWNTNAGLFLCKNNSVNALQCICHGGKNKHQSGLISVGYFTMSIICSTSYPPSRVCLPLVFPKKHPTHEKRSEAKQLLKTGEKETLKINDWYTKTERQSRGQGAMRRKWEGGRRRRSWESEGSSTTWYSFTTKENA